MLDGIHALKIPKMKHSSAWLFCLTLNPKSGFIDLPDLAVDWYSVIYTQGVEVAKTTQVDAVNKKYSFKHKIQLIIFMISSINK